MSQLLASDLNNPEFAGPVDPDSLLHCEFYMHNPVDKWNSEQESIKTGRKVVLNKYEKPVPFVRIMKPGDNTTTIETEVRESHKRRFPKQWLYFQMNEGLIDDGQNIMGWKLDEWEELKNQPETLRDLKYRRFYTVEQVAGASDGQIQGMGIGGMGLRERARAALRAKISADVNEKIDEKDKVIAEMQAQMKLMQEQMAALTMKTDEPKARRGRPPKAA